MARLNQGRSCSLEPRTDRADGCGHLRETFDQASGRRRDAGGTQRAGDEYFSSVTTAGNACEANLNLWQRAKCQIQSPTTQPIAQRNVDKRRSRSHSTETPTQPKRDVYLKRRLTSSKVPQMFSKFAQLRLERKDWDVRH
jgi:hypothetical protein